MTCAQSNSRSGRMIDRRKVTEENSHVLSVERNSFIFDYLTLKALQSNWDLVPPRKGVIRQLRLVEDKLDIRKWLPPYRLSASGPFSSLLSLLLSISMFHQHVLIFVSPINYFQLPFFKFPIIFSCFFTSRHSWNTELKINPYYPPLFIIQLEITWLSFFVLGCIALAWCVILYSLL